MKSLRIAALVLLALAVLALPASAQAPEQRQGITVVGTGSVSAVPDVAEWSFSVQTDAATAQAALRANAVKMRRVLAVLRSAGIAARDLRTEQVSLYPNTNDEGTRVVGFAASNTIHATVRGLARSAAVLDAAVGAGATEVFGPALVTSETEALYAQALDQAFDKARAKAERVAAKAGMALGRPVAIQEGGRGGESLPFSDGAVAARAEEFTPIEAGVNEITATLFVTFAAS